MGIAAIAGIEADRRDQRRSAPKLIARDRRAKYQRQDAMGIADIGKAKPTTKVRRRGEQPRSKGRNTGGVHLITRQSPGMICINRLES